LNTFYILASREMMMKNLDVFSSLREFTVYKKGG
jgi:hypothetical protein